MTTTPGTRTLTRVGTAWHDAEQAALVALDPTGWHGQITAEVDTWFGALAFWHDLTPAASSMMVPSRRSLDRPRSTRC
jgi:hypothetical protein